jgi:RNA polymerase sigma-70 factor (ECF subfamily)
MLKPRSEVLDEAGSALPDDAELDRLFRQHAAFVARVLRRFGVAASDVADASQDVFIVVQRKLPDFEQRAAVTTWLYRISARVASDYRKRAHRRYEQRDAPVPELGIAADQEQSAREHELAVQLGRALDRLCDDKRQVFVLYELEELSMSEIAAALGCPLKTAFSRLYAARRELRADLLRAGYACAPSALLLLLPWKARAAVELRGALDLLGTPTHTALAPQGVAAVVPAAQCAPLAHAATASAALNQACAIASTAGLLAVAAIGLPRLFPEPGATLTQATVLADRSDPALARTPRYQLTPSHLPVHAPSVAPALSRSRSLTPTRPRTSPPSIPTPAPASAAAALPQPPGSSSATPRWIHAPDPAPRATRTTAATPAVGLDEVLAATSVEPLMRFSPAPRSDRARPFALVPDRRARSHTR